jgi:hypothetical protein
LNVQFAELYLRQIMDTKFRYDAILFTSVLHEFYSYGEGMSSVMRALAGAYELLNPNGVIIIRDMILPIASLYRPPSPSIVHKILFADVPAPLFFHDFVSKHGEITTLCDLNHFMLKYMYEENWERECAENYVPIFLEQYLTLFELLGMRRVAIRGPYALPYLRDKWCRDFGLREDDIADLYSTTIIVMQRNAPIPRAEKSGASDAPRSAGQLLGAAGGRARAASLNPMQRSEIARKAALTRWSRLNAGGKP